VHWERELTVAHFKEKRINSNQINELTIAIPGEHTTANLLFSMAFPMAKKKNHGLLQN
jgi:predicted solute-binding protein